MKKEIIAGLILALLFAGSVVNIHYMDSLADELIGQVETAQSYARAGDYARAKAENHGQAIEIEAAHRARAREMELAVFRTLEPRAVLALAMEELGRNASKVGNLTITSEMLASLLNGTGNGQDRRD